MAEFLLTSALILFLVLIVPRAFRWLTSSAKIFYPAMVVLLLTTLIPIPSWDSNLLGLFIGNGIQVSFPVLQYLPPSSFFGIFLARKRNIFSLPFLLGSLLFIVLLFIAHQNDLLTRFPHRSFGYSGHWGLFIFSSSSRT